MPVYVVSKDSDVQNHVQVFEVWNTKDDHENALENLAATEFIAQARPLLDGTTQDHRTGREAAVYTRIIEDERGSAEIKRCAKGHFVRKRLLDDDGEVYRTFRSILGP